MLSHSAAEQTPLYVHVIPKMNSALAMMKSEFMIIRQHAY